LDKTKFEGCKVNFDDAQFFEGVVSFNSAEFTGGRVSFTHAQFTGGQVNFGQVRDWSHPPAFTFSGQPPSGVALPPTETETAPGIS
jgi:Pentapeptide repeats (9 copies)